jgi:hypothetical protein
MGGRKVVLVLTAGFSFLNTGIFWWEAKTKRLFSQCTVYILAVQFAKLANGCIADLSINTGAILQLSCILAVSTSLPRS